MFKKIFIDLCNQNKESPSSVCKKVGIAPATFSCWTDKSVPRRATLQRISDYFGVSVDYLLGAEQEKKATATAAAKSNLIPLSPFVRQVTEHEGKVLDAYRAQVEMQPAVDKLLGVPAEEETVTLYSAAYSKDNTPEEIITISKAEWERLKSLPFTDQDL